MANSFAETVLTSFDGIGVGKPVLIAETYDEKNFGNATAMIKVDDVQLLVVNDRGMVTVEVVLQIIDPVGPAVHPALEGSVGGETEPVCPLEAFAVVLGWIQFRELVAHYKLDGDDWEHDTVPPPEPYLGFERALTLLRNNWDTFTASSKKHAVQLKAGDVEAELQERLEKQLRGGPPAP